MKRRQLLQTAGFGLVTSAAAFLFMAYVTLTPPRAMQSTLTESTVPSTNVPGPVAITYYLPKNYDAKRAEPYPSSFNFMVLLHVFYVAREDIYGEICSHADIGAEKPQGDSRRS
jgi:hypothetical protein